MLIPIIGFSPSGEPLLGDQGFEVADVPSFEIVRRLGVASPLVLCLPAELLKAPPSEAICELMRETTTVVGPFALERADEAREWLSMGAHYALFLPPANLGIGAECPPAAKPLAEVVRAAAAEVAIPAERMMLLVDVPALENAAALARFQADIESLAAPAGSGCYECCKKETCGAVSGVCVVVPPGTSEKIEADLLGVLGPLAARDRLQVFLGGLSMLTSSAQPSSVGHLHHSFAIHALGAATLAEEANSPHTRGGPAGGFVGAPPVAVVELPAAAASLYALFAAPALELGPAVAACVRTDRSDGLFPTLVLEADGAALGLVYSSTQSIGAALRCGRGVYWSRSRSSLWRKGDTSGAWQTLRRIQLDCDADALCFTVTQHGIPPAFCHKTSLSCWGQPTGLHALQLTLFARKASAPPGSYTKRLFDDATLLRNKLVEEAQELAEATEPDHVAAEAADLIYFAMVRCVAAGVGLPQISSHLDRRALKLERRPGHSKASRIAAGDAILSAVLSEAKGKAGAAPASTGAVVGASTGAGRARWLPVIAFGVYALYFAPGTTLALGQAAQAAAAAAASKATAATNTVAAAAAAVASAVSRRRGQ
jgi:phosphoribosyl-ATP pyrophosphohydrolase/phosphoribosyl-AMP cyclohydrolase/histidinol dehydrogenase